MLLKTDYSFNGNVLLDNRTISVGERLFVSGKVKVLHALWHPGSQLDSHITVLTSDNTIRLSKFSAVFQKM